MTREMSFLVLQRTGRLCYIAWGLFHIVVARDIFLLGQTEHGIAQGRIFQLAAYMLCIAVAAIIVALAGNWTNKSMAYWFNLGLVGWADIVWLLVVVVPGYVPLGRGLIPPIVFLAGAILTSIAHFSKGPATPAI